MKTVIYLGLLTMFLMPQAGSADCNFSDAVATFKNELVTNSYISNTVGLRFILDSGVTPFPIVSGKYRFVTDDGKWMGPVIVDLKMCSVKTDGNWVMFKTVDETGSPL